MKTKIPRNRRIASESADQIETLYLSLLRAFYEEDDPTQAAPIASKLETILEQRPDVADSIFGEEVRSLLAELDGDLDEAIRSRGARSPRFPTCTS